MPHTAIITYRRVRDIPEGRFLVGNALVFSGKMIPEHYISLPAEIIKELQSEDIRDVWLFIGPSDETIEAGLEMVSLFRKIGKKPNIIFCSCRINDISYAFRGLVGGHAISWNDCNPQEEIHKILKSINR